MTSPAGARALLGNVAVEQFFHALLRNTWKVLLVVWFNRMNVCPVLHILPKMKYSGKFWLHHTPCKVTLNIWACTFRGHTQVLACIGCCCQHTLGHPSSPHIAPPSLHTQNEFSLLPACCTDGNMLLLPHMASSLSSKQLICIEVKCFALSKRSWIRFKLLRSEDYKWMSV